MFQHLDDKFLERWANLYTLVRSIPNDERFSIEVECGPEPLAPCGTVACAAGHAGLHPWFRRRGLVWRDARGAYGWPRTEPQEFFGYGEWFDCTYNDRVPLCPEYYDTWSEDIPPKKVAAGIRQYMEEHWPVRRVRNAIREATAAYSMEHVKKNAKWDEVVS